MEVDTTRLHEKGKVNKDGTDEIEPTEEESKEKETKRSTVNMESKPRVTNQADTKKTIKVKGKDRLLEQVGG